MGLRHDRIGLRRRVLLARSQAEADGIVQAAPDSFLEGEEISDPAVRAVLTSPEDIIVGTPAVAAEILIEQARDLQLIGRHLAPALRKAAL